MSGVRRTTSAAALTAAAVMIASVVATEPADANQDNWGTPPNVCTNITYGNCVPAISPQQTVKGTTSLQVMVTCEDAPAVGAQIPGTQQDVLGPFYQSLAYAVYPAALPGSTNYGDYVGWTTTSSLVSGEEVSTVATSGYANTNSQGAFEVYQWGATPVKVYNAELIGESTTVTFAAGCTNFEGTTLIGTSAAVSADSVERQMDAAAREARSVAMKSVRDFATGKRTRAEFQIKARSRTGVEVHDRINLKAGRTERTTLLCPRGMTPSGNPQTSYGFDALKDVSDYEPRITATRAWSKRGITLSYSAGKLKYPTVAYTVLPCAKPTR